ncbi:S41 family peptidase [Spongiimicrobium sp. 3-5]|uniref:S41 family peptidase n=1 Tax=Spongiimicrobium sp. 3-5 TaxID=3332596 RepID=UPI00398176A7
MKNYKTFLISAYLIGLHHFGYAQKKPDLLTSSEKIETTKSVGRIINENYIFPEVADKIVALLDGKLKNGEYKAVKDPSEFAEMLTKDIQSFNHDRHLRVLFEPQRIAEQKKVISAEDRLRLEQDYIEELKRKNYFFKEVKILEGNIGYIDFRRFRDPIYAAQTAISALNFLSNTEAIIIDLRYNGGGSPKMVQLISSYFFGDEPVHLNSIYKRKNKQDKQYWTLPYIDGNKNPDAHLYILTSKMTFSGAEEFAYNLKHLKRAILIGESTGGGAHPGGRIAANDKFNVWTPTGRSINPITGTNWEGVGVIPHIQTSAQEALLAAHIKALDSLKTESEDLNQKKYYQWHLQILEAKRKPASVALSTLKTYVGDYGIRNISLEDGSLYYQRKNATRYKLIPVDQTTFIMNEFQDFRVQFSKSNNEVVALLGLNEDGTSTEYKKTK